MRARLAEDAWSDHGIVPGAVVANRYVLHQLVGEGGAGRVFRGEDRALSRTVAVKLMRPDLARKPAMVRRFTDEGRMASLIKHPGSVAIIDHGVSQPGGPFLVMDFVQGPSLGRIVATSGPLVLGRVADLVGQVLAFLAVAHRARVAHGDLTSANVLVDTTEKGDRVKVIDFGLARQFQPSLDDEEGDGALSGTPEYLAPEVISGRATGASSDLYAAGVLLHEVLTGTTPFSDREIGVILQRQLRDAVVPPSLRRPDRVIPPALDAVVMRALAKKPADRYPDAAAFRAALGAAIGDHLRHAGPRTTASVHVGWNVDSPAVHARSTGTPALKPLRHAIAAALRRGSVEEITQAYLELARVLAAADRLPAAIGELEEAIDMVSASIGSSTRLGSTALSRLLGGLAGLHELAGNHHLARRAVIKAHWLGRWGARSAAAARDDRGEQAGAPHATR